MQKRNTNRVSLRSFTGKTAVLLSVLITIGILAGCAEEPQETMDDPVDPLEAPEDEQLEDPFEAPEDEQLEDPFEDTEDLEGIEEMEEEGLEDLFDEEAAEEMPDMLAEPEGEENGFEQARPQLEEQLIQEKQDEVIMEHMDELREEADVQVDMDAVETGGDDAVVATVNGEEIYGEQLRQMEEHEMQQLSMFGIDPESEEAEELIADLRPQIVENLVAVSVVEQKTEEMGITVTEEDVEQQYQMYTQQFGGEQQLEQQLEQAGMSSEDLKDEIAQQLPVQIYITQYLEEHMDEEDLEFSEEELRELYDMQQEQMQQLDM